MEIQSLGATEEVTGSCHLVTVGDYRILLDCGMFQGNHGSEMRNREPFPFEASGIDAVVLSHAHIDHSGRLPMLANAGFSGPVYTHRATRDLCDILLRDSAYLNEKSVEWENRRRQRKHMPLIEALYTQEDAARVMKQFRGLAYDEPRQILPGIGLCLRDAGHILGSAIVELTLTEGEVRRKLVFSGDLGQSGMPILRDPSLVEEADLVLMESTYGDRLHREPRQTHEEIRDIVAQAGHARGNILIPAFAVGRTQALLYWMATHYEEAGLAAWQVFLDSPLAIRATNVYYRHSDLYDREAARLWGRNGKRKLLPNLSYSRTTAQSIAINRIRSGAIIVAGSGMCNGGRIKYHLKNNLWRKEAHIIILGYQARGTPGRALVDGAKSIRIFGESIRVGATIHTVGGLSAHADQGELVSWYRGFRNRPPVALVHGESEALQALAERLSTESGAEVTIMKKNQNIRLDKLPSKRTKPHAQ